MGLSELKCILVITKKDMWATNSNLLSFWHIQRMKNSMLLNIYRNKLRKPESSQNDCCHLLLSHDKPRGPSSKDTISRWCKNVLKSAGILMCLSLQHTVLVLCQPLSWRMPISKISWRKQPGLMREHFDVTIINQPIMYSIFVTRFCIWQTRATDLFSH